MSFLYYFYYFYYTFMGAPLVIRVAVICITIFLPLFIITASILIKNHIRYHKKKKFRSRIKERYSEAMRIIMTSERDFYSKDIRELLEWKEGKLNTAKKRILTNLLLSLKNKEEYVNKENFRKLVQNFEIQEFWEKKVKYGYSVSKCRAMRKLDDLDIEISGSLLSSLTYDRNPYLRKKARCYYMYFSEHNSFKFLNEDYDKTFNEWDKVEIHRILCKRNSEDLPNLTQWIKNSQNNNFKSFLIDEMLHFNQIENASYLTKMLKTEDMNLRIKVIYALGEMNYQAAENNLLKDYHIQPQPVQHAIIKAIKKLNTGKSLQFLKDTFMNAYDHETKLVILDAVFNYGPEGKKLFYQLKEKSYGFNHLIFKHVSNPLIAVN